MYLDVKAPVSLYTVKRNQRNRMVSEDIEAFTFCSIAARNFVTDIL